jgi:lysophospholipase L1-like esterase
VVFQRGLVTIALFGVFAICSLSTAGIRLGSPALGESATPSTSSSKVWRILPLGDSITAGVPRCPTYRYWLWKQLETNGYRFDFIGSQRSQWTKRLKQRHPDWQQFDGDHEGHGGWKTDRMVRNLPRFLKSYTPDIVLLHFGTNDVSSDDSTSSTVQELDQLITQLREDNPRVVILLAKLIPMDRSRNKALLALNRGIGRLAVTRIKSGASIVVVDHSVGFNAEAHTIDGIHPNDAGDRIMASHWYDALVKVMEDTP